MSIFVCKVCGHVEFGEAPGTCPACGLPKENFEQNDNVFTETAEQNQEGAIKHIPAITVNKSCGLIPENPCVDVIVRVGETLHPMTDDHFIQFIDCYVDDNFVQRIALTPGVEPAGCIHLKVTGSKVRVVENCNKHGLWTAEALL